MRFPGEVDSFEFIFLGTAIRPLIAHDDDLRLRALLEWFRPRQHIAKHAKEEGLVEGNTGASQHSRHVLPTLWG